METMAVMVRHTGTLLMVALVFKMCKTMRFSESSCKRIEAGLFVFMFVGAWPVNKKPCQEALLINPSFSPVQSCWHKIRCPRIQGLPWFPLSVKPSEFERVFIQSTYGEGHA